MNLPDLLPPSDLLKQVEGIESGLRQRQRLGMLGLILALLQIIVLVINNKWLEGITTTDWTSIIKQRWGLLLILAGIIAALILAAWSRFWLEESQAPFRYTYSISDLKPIIGEKGEKDAGFKQNSLSLQLSHDLADRLNRRIERLFLLDDEYVKAKVEGESKADTEQKRSKGKTETRWKSHIHISGRYLIRQKPDGQWFVEVMPRVRIGPPGSPETLAHAVKFKLPGEMASENGEPPPLTAKHYEQILERVYFSVATEIYKQIREDVKRKIEMLPTRYYQGVALFHEAEDYAKSNTLDAYNEALKLYREAIYNFDPSLKPMPEEWLLRMGQWIVRGLNYIRLLPRRLLLPIFLRLGKPDLMCARAEIGYANMLIYRRVLASISAQRINPVFEARPVADRAIQRLLRLPLDAPGKLNDAPGRKQTLFDAYVTLSLAWFFLGDTERAKADLDNARRLDPARSEDDSRFLFAKGELETHGEAKLHAFQRSVEINPRFDIAQFERGIRLEMSWRTRLALERNVAEMIFREYEALLNTNPGNVAAWTNMGYMRWLLKDTEQAADAFEGGRDYKEIKRETYVAELDYGLARIAAEKGDFDGAFHHFESAMSALVAQGVSHSGYGETPEFYYYDYISRPIINRFEDYKIKVQENLCLWVDDDGNERSFQEIVDCLQVSDKQACTLHSLICLFERVAARITNSEREQISNWAKSQPDTLSLKATLSKGRLNDLAKELETSFAYSWNEAHAAELVKILKDPVFDNLISRFLPKQRIRDAVLAFMLDDYGNACYKYYARFGDARYLEKAEDAYEEAVRKKDDFVIAHFHRYRLDLGNGKTLAADEHLNKVVALDPNWSDAKLARMRIVAQGSIIKSLRDEAEQQRAVAYRKRAEAEAKQKELDQIAQSATPAGIEKAQLPTDPDAQKGYSQVEARQKDVKTTAQSLTNMPQTDRNLEKKLAEELQELKKELGKLWEKINELVADAENRELKIESDIDELLNDLLPHAWLWYPDGNFHWKVFDRKDYLKSLKWEREFNDLHAIALLTWGLSREYLRSIRPRDEEEFNSATAQQLAARNVRLKKGTEKKKAATNKLFEHIRTHFLPTHYDLLTTLRKSPNYEDKEEEFSRIIMSTTANWMQSDSYIAIITVNSNDSEDFRFQVYTKALGIADLPEVCCKMVGDGLLKLGREAEDKLSKLRSEAENGLIQLSSEEEEKLIKLASEAKTNALKMYQRATKSPLQIEKWKGDILSNLGKSDEALAAYRQAMNTEDAELLFSIAESFERLKLWPDALKAYRRAKSCGVRQTFTDHSQGNYHVRIGRNLLAMGREEAAHEFKALASIPSMTGRWRDLLVRECNHHIASMGGYQLMKLWLEDERERCRRERDQVGLSDAQNALLTLVENNYVKLKWPYSGEVLSEMYPVVTPIAIRVDPAIFSNTEFEQRLNQVKERIETDMGMELPRVRVISEHHPDYRNIFMVMINEVAMARGEVLPKHKFCPSYKDSLPSTFVPAPNTLGINPQTGEMDGAWVAEEYLKSLETPDHDKVQAWDCLEYASYYLESYLRQDLTSFIGLQEVQDRLSKWQHEGCHKEAQGHSELIKNALSASGAQLRLTRTLQGLVKESVPITDLSSILEVFQRPEFDGQDPLRLVEAVRLRLKSELPGNNASSQFLYLPPSFESELKRWIGERDGKLFFAIEPEETQALLTAIRQSVAGRKQSRLVIVTRTDGIRPFVRRLIELEFPRIRVLSLQELRRDLRSRVTGIIKYEK